MLWKQSGFRLDTIFFHLTRGHVECARIEEQLAAHVPGVDLCEIREPDVVADPEPDLGERRLERREAVARRQRVRLLEADLAGHVDVEEMDLAVLGDHLAGRGPDRGRVVQLVRRITLGDRATDQVDLAER